MPGETVIIQCGECKTKFRFSLPDRPPPGIRLKCGVCKTVFTLALPDSARARKPVPKMIDLSLLDANPDAGGAGLMQGEAGPPGAIARPAPRSGLRRAFLFVLAAGLIAGVLAAAGFLWMNPAWLESRPDQEMDPAEKVRIGDLQQRFIANARLGRLRIIEGTVTNESDTPLTRIRMLGKLYDEQSVLLAVQSASCGRILPNDMLAAMSDQDLIAARDETGPWEQADGRDRGRVLPGEQLRFMVVFAGEPAGVFHATVSAISARKAE